MKTGLNLLFFAGIMLFNGMEYSMAQTNTFRFNDTVVVSIVKRLEGKELRKHTRISTLFNSRSNPVTTLYEAWQDKTWISVEREHFKYNAKGEVTARGVQFLVDKKWENNRQTEESWHYDSTGRKTSGKFRKKNDSGEWEDLREYFYEYDSMSKSYTEYTKTLNNNLWQHTRQSTYTYTKSGFLTGVVTMVWDISKQIWINEHKTNFVNGENGRVEEVRHYQWEKNEWSALTRSIFQYGKTGKVQEVLEQTYKENEWKNERNQILTYSKKGLLVTRKELRFNGDTLESNPDRVEEYSYSRRKD